MTIIENIDVVMGAQTRELDASIAKEIANLRQMGDSINGISGAAAAFTPVGSMVAATVASFAQNLPGVSSAVGIFTASAASITAAMAMKAKKADDLAKSLEKVKKEAKEAKVELQKVADPDIVSQALSGRGGAMPRGLMGNKSSARAAEDLANAARIGSRQDIQSAFLSAGSQRSKKDQDDYIAGIDASIAKTATYKSTWTNTGSAIQSAAGIGKIGVAGLAVGVGVAVAGVVSLNHVIGEVREQMTVIDDMSDGAKRLSMSFADLSTARMSLAQTSGLDQGSIDSSLQRMQLGLSEANATGAGGVADSMRAIGLDAGDLLKKGPLEAFKEISRATQDLKNPTDQLAVAYELFGKQGAALVSSLREGPAEIERMNNLAQSLGMNLTDAQAEQVGAANDAWDEMGMIATGAYRQIAAEVAPVVQVIAEYITDGAQSFSGWQGYITPVIDGTVFLSGVLYDVAELTGVVSTTLRNIATLNWTEVGKDITSAFDFGTGQRNIDALMKARQDAANKAGSAKDPTADSVIAQIERQKEAAKELAEVEKKQAADRKLLEDDSRRKSEEIQKQINGLRDQNAILAEGNRLRAQGKQVDDEDIALRRDLASKTGGSSNTIVDRLIAERKALEQVKSDQEKALSIKADDPATKLKDSMRELMRLRDSGLINASTFNKQAAKAEQSAGFADSKTGAVSAQAGSVEAYKLMLNRESEATKVAKSQERIAQSQLEVMQEMRDGIGKLKPMKAAR